MADSLTATQPSPPAKLRFRGIVVIILLLAMCLLVIAWEPDFLRGMHSIATMAVVACAIAASVVWFFRYSGISGRGRYWGALAMLLAAGALALSVRVDGWDGSMRPLFAWRWMPTAEEQFQANRATSEAKTLAEIELPAITSADYPGFLGADRRGVIEGVRLESDWDAHPPRELWRKPVGLAWSAFAIVGDFAFTQEQREGNEAVVCYGLKTGVEHWSHTDEARFSEALGGDGPRATPTVHEGRVFALGATGILNCLEGATGQRVWTRNILQDAGVGNRDWGMAGSPLIVGDVVIVAPGGNEGNSTWAYRVDTGDPVWHAGDDPACYSSPLLTTLAGKEQVLVLTASALVSHDPADGRQLWRHEWKPEQVIKCAQPVPLADFGYAKGQDQVLISSGYTVGSQLVQVQLRDNQWKVEPLWSSRQLRAKFSNMIVQGDFVYGLDEGILTCLDLRDGSRQWKAGRYGHGQLLLVDKLLLVQAENGEVVLLEISPKQPRELGRLKALSDKTWNNPAVAGRYLLVRNDREAACYELPLAGP